MPGIQLIWLCARQTPSLALEVNTFRHDESQPHAHEMCGLFHNLVLFLTRNANASEMECLTFQLRIFWFCLVFVGFAFFVYRPHPLFFLGLTPS